MDEKIGKTVINESNEQLVNTCMKSVKTTPVLIVPNHTFNKQMSSLNSSQYSQIDTNINCIPKLSVHYIVSLNNDQSIISCDKQIDHDINNSVTKMEITEGDRKCLISLPLDTNCHNECDSSNTLKTSQSITNQRLLISPTDFLTLSEDGISHRNSAVRKDVNLSTSSLEIIRRNNIESNYAICLDRYCESPLLLEAHKDSHLICDDETSCNGRNSRLSESPEDITTDELFANTFGTDQSSTLREVVTPIEVESARNTPTSLHKDMLSTNNKDKNNIEDSLLCDDIKPNIETIDIKPILTVLNPLESTSNTTSCQTQTEGTFTMISSQPEVSNVTTSQSLPLTTLDIKVLPTGMLAKDSILLANLAAALPSSLTSRQIALQVIREDGTSLVLPLNTKQETNDVIHHKEGSNDMAVSTSVVLAEVVSSNESIRPFKCELCNSTFTRLGNYTRHKKIHSYPSKEDQRFRCDICSKSFIQRCDLARHLHIHRGTEPHRCSQCGKGYIRHSDLVTHQRFHNKEKIFSCPHCSKGFCQRGDLNRHLRSIHLQLKPILCSHCHKKFAKEETLLRHMNSSHRDLLDEANEANEANDSNNQTI
ncbi:zinc finger protein 236-like [Oppia nitens]|uniref:zinc finger protein 236-like n=1 Tax=Oppia nitens TaxID=1686743 RepID=UPI0023DBD7C5|nr:zinc finger protein 236-like [Oppia nitens]